MSVRLGLSVRQPFALKLASGDKTRELRTWLPRSRAKLGDRIAICASLEVDRAACARLGLDPKALPRGVVVGFATIADWRPAVPEDATAACVERAALVEWIAAASRRGQTLFAWEMTDAVAVPEPSVRVKGAVGRLIDVSALGLVEPAQ